MLHGKKNTEVRKNLYTWQLWTDIFSLDRSFQAPKPGQQLVENLVMEQVARVIVIGLIALIL